MSIFFPPAEYTKLALTIEIAEEKFFANSKICTDLGYLVLYKDDKKKQDKEAEVGAEGEEEESPSNADLIKKIKKGQKLNIDNYETTFIV